MAQDFFLPPDDAKTLGNIDFMRTKQSIKKTYPKGKRPDEIVEVSAMERQTKSGDRMMQPKPTSVETPKSVEPAVPQAPTRRPDKGMDMFRAMAREIKK